MSAIKLFIAGYITTLPIANLAHADNSQATAAITQTEGNSAVIGQLNLTQSGNKMRIDGKINGLKPGDHGFHIHENGDCGGVDAKNAGGHFNPGGEKHGGLNAAHSHVGDLGNIKADETGLAVVSIESSNLALTGTNSVVGRSVLVHEKHDDLVTQPSGASVNKIACGIIK